MKKYINNKTLLGALVGAALLPLASCDDIDEADRIVTGKLETVVVQPDTLTLEVEGEAFTYVDEHKLLIEDFTGWKCVNCPTVAEYLTTQITNNYPSVLVSLHMTTNSFSQRQADGYNCASADSIADLLFGEAIASKLPLPSVAIDQVKTEEGFATAKQNVLGALALSRFTACNITKEAPQVGIGINVEPLQDAAVFDIHTLVNAADLKSCNLKLWLIEEGLRSKMQQSSNGFIKDYLNHGILRMVINGACTGQEVSLNDDGQAIVRHRLNLEGLGYVGENCRVVAIVSDENGVVMNCNEVELEKIQK